MRASSFGKSKTAGSLGSPLSIHDPPGISDGKASGDYGRGTSCTCSSCASSPSSWRRGSSSGSLLSVGIRPLRPVHQHVSTVKQQCQPPDYHKLHRRLTGSFVSIDIFVRSRSRRTDRRYLRAAASGPGHPLGGRETEGSFSTPPTLLLTAISRRDRVKSKEKAAGP